ncbi:MAG: DNA topoisomerase 3 [Clostridiales bacterium]|jgi:DNA topoisomerase-3|nr:DNA topoisomerase 3 [Clostridiales bacterium]
MKLVIAEKPSVAQSIAKVLGASERKNGFLQGNGYIISWCIGHLVGLWDAGMYQEDFKRWSYQTLPILPERWKTMVQPDKQEQFDVLANWMNDNQITEVICATDAGREGELIFRWVYEQAGCTKPIQRLWISSMEDQAIQEGFANLQDGADFENLYQSALCRAKADWVVGINFTRLFSILYNQKGLNIGRVMTPTLALVVQRQAKIAAFRPEPFFHVSLDCGSFSAVSDRIADESTASQLQVACHGQTAVVQSIEKKNGSELPPKLYDLTTLQREANRILGYTAQQTLNALQSLYEKKLVTYPRTDSQYLTEDMADSTGHIIRLLQAKFLPDSAGSFSPDISRLLNNAKVSDHHAVIPTAEIENLDIASLPSEERDILLLVGYKLLCASAPKHSFESTAATLLCAGQAFSARGKVVLEQGWKEIEGYLKSSLGKSQEDTEETGMDKVLPALQENQSFSSVIASLKKGQTSPPKPFTEDTLLSAMETAGNDQIDEETEKKGLGTPATRAAILEKLVHTGMLERKKKQLMPTQKGIHLITILPDSIKSPKLTAEWENSLNRIAKGEIAPQTFLQQINSMVTILVNENPAPKEEFLSLFPKPEKEEIGKCPRCQQSVYESQKSFYCSNSDCSFTMWKNDLFFTSKKKELTKRIAKDLLTTGKSSVKGLFSEKKGTSYDATVVLADTGGKYVNFSLEFPKTPKTKGKKS